MNPFEKFASKLKPRPSDVNGIDFGTSGTYLVRLRKSGDAFSLLGTEIMPAIDFQTNANAFSIPQKLRASYAAIAMNAPAMSIKLLTQPGAVDAAFEQKLALNLGLPEDTADRIGYTILSEGAGRSESRILAVAMPEPQSTNCISLFETGLPAPWTFEASPVAALTAFAANAAVVHGNDAVGLLDFSSRFCTFSIFQKNHLVLLRRFDFGMHKVLARITASLNVDERTAANILIDGAFDISDLLHDIMQPLFSQLVVSRDFIERRESCSMQTLFLRGAFANSEAAREHLEQALNVPLSIWDPFDIPNLTISTPLPPEHESQRWRFAAALGAALAVFEEAT